MNTFTSSISIVTIDITNTIPYFMNNSKEILIIIEIIKTLIIQINYAYDDDYEDDDDDDDDNDNNNDNDDDNDDNDDDDDDNDFRRVDDNWGS